MLRVDESWLERAEQSYPGLRDIVQAHEAAGLPACPKCASTDTAIVSAGLVGMSIHLAAATTKFKLVANDRPGAYYCNACGAFFDAARKSAEE